MLFPHEPAMAASQVYRRAGYASPDGFYLIDGVNNTPAQVSDLVQRRQILVERVVRQALAELVPDIGVPGMSPAEVARHVIAHAALAERVRVRAAHLFHPQVDSDLLRITYVKTAARPQASGEKNPTSLPVQIRG
jgi:hypothetical protein